MSRRLRVLLGAGAALATLLGIVAAGLWWLTGTTSGARWALARILPEGVSVRAVDGRLLGPLRLAGLSFRDPDGLVDAEAAAVAVRWSPRRLLGGTLRVEELRAEGVRVRFRRGLREALPAPPPPGEMARGAGQVLSRELRELLPLRVGIELLAVDDARVTVPEWDRPLLVEGMRAHGAFGGGAARLSELAVWGPDIRLDASGRFDPAADPPARARLSGRLSLPGQPPVQGEAAIRGDPDRLRLEGGVRSPVAARLEGEVLDLGGEPSWRLVLDVAETSLARLSPELPEGEVGLSAELRGAAGAASGRIRARGRVDPWGSFAAGAELSLSGDSLRLTSLRAVHPGTGGRLTVSGGGHRREGAWAAALEGSWSGFRWPPTGPPAARSPSGTFRLAGRPDSLTFGAAFRVAPSGGPSGPWTVELEGRLGGGRVETELRGRGSLRGAGELTLDGAVAAAADTVELRRLRIRQRGSGGRLTAAGGASLGDGATRFRIRADWRDLEWPAGGPGPATRSRRGRLELTGTPERVRFHLGGSAEPAGLPEATVSATGEARPDRVEVTELRARLLDGTLRGSARWARAGDRETGAISLELRDLDPGLEWPRWPGEISARLDATLRRGPDGHGGHVRLHELGGTLRDRPIGGTLSLEGESGSWRLRELLLRSGTARLEASGRMADRWEGSWSLQAGDLSALAPGLSGRTEANGAVEGPRDRPALSATVRADSLEAAGVSLERLEGTLRWAGGTDPREGGGEIEARAAGVAVAGLELDGVSLGVRGGLEESRLALRLEADDAEASVQLSGGVADGAWRGTLDSLALRSPRVGAWSLAAPASVAVAADSARLGDFCWARAAGRLCLKEAAWSRRRGLTWEGEGRGLPLALAEAWLPEDLALSGDLGFETRGSVVPDREPVGWLRLRAGPGGLRRGGGGDGAGGGRTYGSLTVDAEAGPDGHRAELRLDAGGGDFLRAAVELGPSSGGDRSLQGRLQAAVSDRGAVGELVDALAATRGRVEAAVLLAGTLGEPAVQGDLSLVDGAAEVPGAGVEVRDVGVRLSGDGSGRLRVTGGATSGGGRLDVDGEIELAGQAGPGAGSGVRADLRIRGERFLVLARRGIQVRVSPDLRAEVEGGNLQLTGALGVPEARISVRRLEAAVTPSADVVVRGREGAGPVDDGPEAIGALPVSAEVDVILGDRATVDAYGLRGRLVGRLAVTARPGRPPTGRGEISVVEGQYTALRRALPLDRGRLLFAGSPLDDPGLDVRVVRRTSGVEVGLLLAGTVRSPRVTLFSSPELSEPDILSYLIFGRPLAAVNPGEGELLRGAVRGLGLTGGDLLAARLGAALGLNDVQLVGEEAGASLVLGARLSPRLELGYSLGLFGVGSALRLTYRLGRGWVLRAESGEEGGADVMYLIER